MTTQSTTQEQQKTNFEVVNEFEYVDKNDLATISVKVGNVVDTLTFSMSWEEDIRVEKPQAIQNLIDAGMEFNWEPLKDAFREQYEETKKRKEEAKREEACNSWDNFWGHDLEESDGVEIHIEDRDDFVERKVNGTHSYYNEPKLYVVYRGEEVLIKKTDVGRNFSRNIKYQIDHRITDHKRRNYGAPENAVAKIVELTDEKIEREECKKNQKDQAQKDREAKVERLAEQFGDYGEIIVEKKKSWGRRNYSIHEFFIQTDEDTKHKIDEHYRDETKFNLGSFGELTAEQVTAMLDILAQ